MSNLSVQHRRIVERCTDNTRNRARRSVQYACKSLGTIAGKAETSRATRAPCLRESGVFPCQRGEFRFVKMGISRLRQTAEVGKVAALRAEVTGYHGGHLLQCLVYISLWAIVSCVHLDSPPHAGALQHQLRCREQARRARFFVGWDWLYFLPIYD